MSIDEPHYGRPSNLLRIMVPLLNSEFVDLLSTLWRLGKRIIASKAHEGMYEVLELDIRLELRDARGDKAILYKRERVRCLQDNIIAYQDKAWGDGKIFEDYK